MRHKSTHKMYLFIIHHIHTVRRYSYTTLSNGVPKISFIGSICYSIKLSLKTILICDL